jgi:Tol biopolymer transport system component
VDNVVIAATPRVPQLIIGQDPQQLQTFAVQAAPDGSRLAFLEYNNEGRARFQTLDTRSGAQRTYGDAAGIAYVSPRFSPDSQQLAYTMIDQSTPQWYWQLQIVGPAHDDVHILQRGVQDPAMHGFKPLVPLAWTSTGLLAQELLWASDAPPHGITHVDTATGKLTTVYDEDYLRAEIAPNGSHAAVLTGILPMGPDVESQVSVSVLDIGSGESKPVLQDGKFWIPTLRWSPDAQRLLYTKQGDMGALITALVVLNADGTNEQTLPIGGSGVRGILKDAAWRDNNTLLLLIADNENKLHLYSLALDNLQPNALQEVAAFDGPKSEGITPRILYVPAS